MAKTCEHRHPVQKTNELATRTLLRRLREIEVLREQLKPLYDEEDEIIKELCKRDDVARHGAVIKDQFMGKTSAWKSVNFKRYIVEWER